jgi:predicted DCC family thiol-disulfide oxidoreductase YuxK
MRDEVGTESGVEVIYDGQCRLCRRSLDIVQRLAGRKVFRLHDANDRESIRSNFRMLADADTEKAMFVVTPRGEVFRGFFAYRRMLWESPRLYPFLPLFYAPGAAHIGPRIYAWVARNRRNLGCSLSSRRPSGDAGRDGSANGDGKQAERLAESSCSREVYPPGIDALPVSGTNTRLASNLSGRFLREKGFASVFSLLLSGATLAPIAQNWRPEPKDGFPFSYYPMFSQKRGDLYRVNYIVGLDTQGNRHLISHKLAGEGGFNQTRRQINRYVRQGTAEELCRSVAARVGRRNKPPYTEIVTVNIVRGAYRFDDYFAGNKAPVSERVRASCPAAPDRQTASDLP